MAAAAHFFPNYQQQLGTHQSTQQIELSGTIDTLYCGLIASTSTYTWGATPEGQTTVTSFLAGDGTNGALTEVSATGYARQALTGVSYTTSGEVNTLTCSNVSWASVTAGFSAKYAFFYDYSANGVNSNSTGLMVCYWDFGGTVSVVTGGTFTLTISGSGLVTWTSS